MTRTLRALVTALVPGLVLGLVLVSAGACGSGPGASGGHQHDQSLEWEVAGDENATADEIVDAGRVADVAASGEQTLVTYVVESDDGEGPQQGAWRLYDGAGARVADGRFAQVREQGARIEVDAFEGGFLLGDYATPALVQVDPSGETAPAKPATTRSPAQAGDLLVESLDGLVLYRPAERASYKLPSVPFGDVQRMALDERGVLWVLRGWTTTTAPLMYAAGGVAPWKRTDVPITPNGYPQGLTAEGGLVAVPTAHGGDAAPTPDPLQVLDTSEPALRWRAVPVEGLELEGTLDPHVQVLPDQRLLVVSDGAGAWLQDETSEFTPVELPSDAETTTVTATGGRLFAIDRRSGGLWVSDDDGGSWDEAAR